MQDVVQTLYTKLEAQRLRLNKYYEYYKGNHDILKTYKPTSRADNKPEVYNFCRLIVDNNVGYLLGVPPTIQYNIADNVDEENIVDSYYNTLGSYIQQADTTLMKYQQIFGFAFELNYINTDGEFGVKTYNPLEMTVIKEGKKVVYGLLEHSEDKFIFWDVRNMKIYNVVREDDKFIIDNEPKINVISNPIIYVRNNNEELSELKDVISLNDAYNLIATDRTAEISQHRNAYLKIGGAKLTASDFEVIQETGIMSFPQPADVDFITKKLDTDYIQQSLEQLKNQIYTVTGNVDFNDNSIGSNTSSIALRNKLISLNNKLSILEGFLTEGLLIRFKNLQEYKLITQDIEPYLYDSTNVTIKFNKNVPTSNMDTAKMVVMLYKEGLLSRETALGLTGLVDDPRLEINRIRSENEFEIDSTVADLFGEVADYAED